MGGQAAQLIVSLTGPRARCSSQQAARLLLLGPLLAFQAAPLWDLRTLQLLLAGFPATARQSLARPLQRYLQQSARLTVSEMVARRLICRTLRACSCEALARRRSPASLTLDLRVPHKVTKYKGTFTRPGL